MAVVITIGRQFGSGGHDVGKLVAEKLGIPFYDKEIVELAAKKSNLSADAVKEVDERATNSFLYTIATGNYGMRGINPILDYEMPLNDRLFLAQTQVIKELAEKGSCVIVGRCADYVLEDEDVEVLSVFLHAPLDFRIARVMEAFDLPKSKAKDKAVKTDKRRRTYYDYYSDNSWGVMSNYDLCINTGKFGIDGAADVIAERVKSKI